MSPISQPHNPIWYVQGNMEEQYHGRMPNLVNRTEPQGQVCYRPFNLVASSDTIERGLQEGSGNIRPSQMPLIPGLEMRSERQTVTREMARRALTAVQRRNRLATEVFLIDHFLLKLNYFYHKLKGRQIISATIIYHLF
jgi:hypothetical protein